MSEMHAHILFVEMFEATEPVRMKDYENGHHLGIGQSAGFVAVRSAVLELARPEFLVENFAKVIGKTENFGNFGFSKHGVRV